jgi:hypothetical protein
VDALSHPSGSDSAAGILPVDPFSSDGRTDAFHYQAIEQQPQVAPYDPQQHAAALDMYYPDGLPTLLSEEIQASLEPLDYGNFIWGSSTTDHVSFMEDQTVTAILPWNESYLASATEPSSASAGLSSLPAVIAAPPAVSQERLACCNKTFSRAGDYRRHMRKHAPHEFRCDCGKPFYRKDKLKAHMRQRHKMTL